MYNARFVKDNGDVFYFDYEHNVLVDIDPLSEISVDIYTSQGFSQVGETVENTAIGGLTRTISGRLLKSANELKHQMLDIFTPFATGKLYFNDKYYCDCWVERTPAIGVLDKDVVYTLALYCAYPYWLASEESIVFMNTWTPCFRFPGPSSAIGTNYDAHCFGTKNESAFVNIYNSGEANAYFDLQFSTDGESVTNYGIINIYTLEYLQINDTLYYGETVRVYRDGAELKVEKTDANGNVTDIFSKLEEESNLFYLTPGDNVLRAYADDEQMPAAIITYNATYAGVYDGM